MGNLPAVRREHEQIIADLRAKGLVFDIRDSKTGKVTSAIRYPGLVALGHERGLIAIETEILQYPAEDNGQRAVTRAIAFFERDGRQMRFSGIGTCSPANANRMTANYPLEMSETRAKGRALKDGLSIGDLRFADELPDTDTDGGWEDQPHAQQQAPQRTAVREEPPQQQQRQAAPSLSVVPPVADVPGSCQPASKDQLDRLVKLQAALGRAKQVPDGLSFEEAAAQIKDLVVLFNERVRGGKK